MDEMHKKSVCDEIRRRNKEKKIQRETDIQDVASDPTCTADTFAIVNNLVESESQTIDKINSCTSSESSHEIKVVANTSQDYAQKCIANSVVDSKVPHDIKTVNDQDKSAQVKSKTFTSYVNKIFETVVKSSNVVTPAKTNDHNDDDSDSGNVDSGSNLDSDESIDSNHPHDILLHEEIARLERISNYPGNSAPTPQMTPVKVDNYDDVYFDEEDLKEDKVESNEVKSDNENNSEEKINESDNDGYSGCDEYNEYGESNRDYYYDLSSRKKTYKNSDYIISAY
ncbi:hypothetical protein F8M41_007213 [Gigaspora margarita]|uniref:Uncharacterized protein n=1 Tax=Gigaspora margarita TaxID=4874 RepID=A0A8H3X5D0_GIGMA|nr:hypothetical protein F8M41_007213 [Gigaspora margarita]